MNAETCKHGSFATYKTRSLWVILAAVAALILITNLTDEDTVTIIGNLAYVPINAAFLLMTVIILGKYRNTKARRFLICFTVTAAIWFVAEISWTLFELVYQEDPFPSVADIFYIVGYISMFFALSLLVVPNWKKITTDVKILGIALSAVLLVPTIMLVQQTDSADFVSNSISFSYPVLDAVLIWFCFILLVKFSAKNDFLYLVVGASLLLIIGDTVFAASSINETYYTGQPIEISWLWSYVVFAYSAHTIRRNPERLFEILKSEGIERHLKLTPRFKIGLVVLTSTIVTLVTVFTTQHLKLTHLSTNQEQFLLPTLYGSVVLLVSATIVEVVTHRAKSSLSVKSESLLHAAWPTSEIEAIEGKLTLLESRGKKNSIIITCSIVIIAITFSFYLWNEIIEQDRDRLINTMFIVENLKGDRVHTWAAWKIPENEIIQVSIINSGFLSAEKNNILKSSINSEDTLNIENAFMNKEPADGSSVYYTGWRGALLSIKDRTTYPVPTTFEIVENDKAVGDIVIILSTQKDTDGSFGFTRTIADEEQNQILKSYITIFNVKDLDNMQLAAIVRHEFGHALGLGHATDSADLMNPAFHSNQAYISECNIDALTSLYNGEKMTEVVCRH